MISFLGLIMHFGCSPATRCPNALTRAISSASLEGVLRVTGDSCVRELTVRFDAHGAVLMGARQVRHRMTITCRSSSEEPHQRGHRRRPGRNHRRPREGLSEPDAPLDLDDPLFCMPKPGHFVHACRDAHDRPGENQPGSQRGLLAAGPGDAVRRGLEPLSELPSSQRLCRSSATARPITSECVARSLATRTVRAHRRAIGHVRATRRAVHSFFESSASMVARGRRDRAAGPVAHTRQSALSIRSSPVKSGYCRAIAILTSSSVRGCPSSCQP
ncbi:hypothetical protein MycrhN_0915 [Mycolicibacterium rhodesiae NBB3]|uniref:Uncharacterized protein n=1 Tax=Mycolicibacterium rhodesiae (strain NBB3) TaxID=710685 RepID=G8RSS3_MYCRN|nr:hypothetical protein MycrhN_0915 [Mycolicibacterium rhodesiae NBB3]